MKVTPTSDLTQDEIERVVQEGDRFRETDSLRRELAEMRNQAETLLYTTEQALDGYADLLEAHVVQEVRDDADRLREVLAGNGGLEDIREAYQCLEAAAFRIAESMYGTEE